MPIVLPWIDEAALATTHPFLFHYTQAQHLDSILASGGLIATKYDLTNDNSEMRHLRNPLVSILVERATPIILAEIAKSDMEIIGPEADFVEVVANDAKKFFDILIRTIPGGPHLTCFSAHQDAHHHENGLLTMWRLYGGAGSGLALGFDTAKLVEITSQIQANNQIDLIFLEQVRYGDHDPETQRRLDDFPGLPNLYAKAALAILENRGEFPPSAHDDLLKFVVLNVCSKHPDFQDEREVRLVTTQATPESQGNRTPLGRVNDRLIIPCMDALTEVIVGPSDDQPSLIETVKNALHHHDLGSVIVRASNTPFRPTQDVIERSRSSAE